MPREKYKVHEVAKDFGTTSKKILELLAKYSDIERKHTTVLEDAELDFLFDSITQANEVASFDAYFAAAAEQQAAKAEAPKAEEAAPAAQAKAEKPAPVSGKAAPVSGKAAPVSGKAAPVSGKAAPVSGKAAPASGKPDAPKAAPQPAPQPPKKKEKDKNKPMQARTKGETKRVDTRQSNVDLDKYNERYEEIAPANRMNSDNAQRKQKLNQKSKQYRKPGAGRSAKRETEAERLKRIAAERAKHQITIKVPDEITVGELAAMLKMTAAEVIKKLFSLGVMATVNEVIDFDTAEIVATELGAKVEKQVVVTIEEQIIDDSEDKEEDLQRRDPVVVVMGHVDHGKTSILDAIRNTAVTATEAGGITQHIGAYRVEIGGQMITFLDTPGHAAFTSMRARGAMATDIAVLVVAADDGIMPQTIEAINHAKAAGVQIIVAINKMDKEGANPERIKQQLTEYSLVPEEWGGDTICVPVSAKTQMGIDSLLESILLVAEMADLKANPNRAAKGVVIEARLDKGRGPIATLLVQNGTLRPGDIIVAGTAVGRVRVMVNERGQRMKSAGPSVPAEVMGLAETPNAGDSFDAVSDERLARELVEQRKQKEKEDKFNAQHKVTLDNLFSSLKEGEMKELNIVVKADVQGSVEAVTQNLEKLSNDEVRVKVIHGGVGAINDSDVMLAGVSNAIIVGFNVRPDSNAQAAAERDGVEMRMYRVIYDCMEEIEAAMKGMLAPKFREVPLGKVEVRTVMNLSSAGKIAGSYVLEGKVTRSAQIRVVRDGIVVTEDEIASLRRFKDDVKEVASGFECGIGLAKFNDIKEGDIFEAFVMEEYRD
ncbi:MAG: translation initiation factor IF-2 [Clostridia bacterium]|nr:translation initiation factor IF-2 [Clostridia bacterium]MBQ6093709.1 translation initiation factor IF-2 [Clostridia bacterium]